MSLADRLSRPVTRPRTRCALGRVLDQLAPADLAAVTAALANKQFTTSHIHRELVADGHEVSRSTVDLHRKETCGCPSPTR